MKKCKVKKKNNNNSKFKLYVRLGLQNRRRCAGRRVKIVRVDSQGNTCSRFHEFVVDRYRYDRSIWQMEKLVERSGVPIKYVHYP